MGTSETFRKAKSVRIQGLHIHLSATVSYRHVRAASYQTDRRYECVRSTCFLGQLSTPAGVGVTSLNNNEQSISEYELVTITGRLAFFS